MDLTNLRDSLDVSSRERHPASTSAKKSELRLTRDFKAAALHLTTLYRTSLSSAKKSYTSGYAQSLHDILDVVMLRLQQGPSPAPGHPSHHLPHLRQQISGAEANNREELVWLIRYLGARIEAIKAESEDDEEDKDSEDEDEEVSSNVNVNRTGGGGGGAAAREEKAATAKRGDAIEVDARSNTSDKDGEALEKARKSAELDEERTSISIPPTTSTFTFSPPSTSVEQFAPQNAVSHTIPHSHSRRRIKSLAALQHNASNSGNPVHPVFSQSSPAEEDEGNGVVSQPQTPSKQRLSSRLGKRTSGRDKVATLDLFGKNINAKRRRGMGDRRDDDMASR